MSKFREVAFTDASGQQQKTRLGLADYKAAEQQGLTLAQYVNLKYPTNPEKYGQTFAQMLASTGLFLTSDRNYGIRPPTMAQVFGEMPQVNLGAITAPN